MNTIKNIVKKILLKNEEHQKYRTQYTVEGTIKNRKTMLFVLAGYKPYLWNDVFSRIRKNQIKDMEVCIASSGKYVKELSDICKANDWVYISTILNNVCVVTNIIMREFCKADYIFKLDEDIYIHDRYFDDMILAYEEIENNEPTEIGYVCPQLPLGFYGMHDFLLEHNKLEEFERKFGRHKVGGTAVNPFLRTNSGVDEYIWSVIGNFDAMAEEYRLRSLSYSPCYSRSGIAAILFKRTFWNKIGGLKKTRGVGVGNNGDEGQITSFCALNYQVCYCVDNVLVGHFAFGGSEESVLRYKDLHPETFVYKSSQCGSR